MRFSDFIFNDGNPLSAYRSGNIRIQDTAPPNLLSGPNAQNIRTNSAIITWQTDEPSDSRVDFGINSTDENIIIDESTHLGHSIFLQGLQANTRYEYEIASRDSAGNEWQSLQIYEFQTLPTRRIIISMDSLSADRNELLWITANIYGNEDRLIFSAEFDLFFEPDVLEFRNCLLSAAGTENWNSEFQQITNGEIHVRFQGDQPITEGGEFVNFNFLLLLLSYVILRQFSYILLH